MHKMWTSLPYHVASILSVEEAETADMGTNER